MPLFNGGRSDLERFLLKVGRHYYVYVLRRPDKTPFYVGKGKGRRLLQHEAEARQHHPFGESNPYKCNVIRKILYAGEELLYEIDSTFHEHDEAGSLDREAKLISKWKRLHEGGVLTNLAGGTGNCSGATPFSLERHKATLSGSPVDNPERATLNRFLQAIGPVGSVPIKPVSQISRILPTTPHTQPRKPTLRNTYALIASASAHGLDFSKPLHIPRMFIHEEVQGIIENGVSRDIIKAGMANLVAADNPKDEIFSLDSRQVDLVAELFGKEALIQRGLL